MRTLLTKTAALITMLIFVLTLKVNAAAGTGELVIYHTNDMHARVTPDDDNGMSVGLAELAAVVKKTKATNPDTLWLDAGDTFHGMPMINISRGMNMVELVNAAGIDAMSPGNHDYNYGVDRLIELSKKLKVTVLSANTVKRGTNKYVFKPYKIYKLPNNIKVGVFGLTTPETAYKSNPKNTEKIEFLNPVEQSKLMIKKLRPKCDVIIAVMHMGVDASSKFTSERIANEAPGIDLIVDGHSHTVLPEGINIGDTLIVQTGWHEHMLGKVNISLKDHKITSKQAQLISKDDIQKMPMFNKQDKAVLDKLKELETRNEKLFNEVIAHSDRNLTSARLVVRRHEAELGNLCADAFRWRTGSDIAIINGGGMRSDLPAGDITRGAVMSIFPFGNTIQVAEIQGKAIREMLEHSVFAYPASFGGFLNVSGMTFSFDPTQPVGQRIKDIYIDKEKLDESKTYTITGNDFLFAGGDDYSMLNGLKIIGEYETCEGALVDYLNQVGMNDIEVGRIKLLKEVPIPDETPDGEIKYEPMKQAA